MIGKFLHLVKSDAGDSPKKEAPAGDKRGSLVKDDIALPRFLTRQPVLDTNTQVIGYELRLRGKGPLPVLPGAKSPVQIQDEALIVSTIDMDFQQLIGNRQLFLPIDPSSLANPIIEQLPKDKVVLCLANGDLTETQLDHCGLLAKSGFRLALDMAGGKGQSSELDELLAYCHYARVDVSGHDAMSLGEQIDLVAAGSKLELIALGVDTEEMFSACRKLPFTLFQGNYFAQMRSASPHQLNSNRLRVMDLLNLVIKHAEVPRLEEKFKLDASLAYRLLRFINSPAIGLRASIKSIAHALVILGHDQLYRWLTLLLFAGAQPTPRDQALLRNALVRARLTEQLGQAKLGKEHQGSLFIAGMLSLLDVLLNMPMAQAIANLNLDQDIADALTERKGPYAPYLQLAVACEHLDDDTIIRSAEELGLGAKEVNMAHIDALVWSEGLDI